jgi:hypothetical protein
MLSRVWACPQVGTTDMTHKEERVDQRNEECPWHTITGPATLLWQPGKQAFLLSMSGQWGRRGAARQTDCASPDCASPAISVPSLLLKHTKKKSRPECLHAQGDTIAPCYLHFSPTHAPTYPPAFEVMGNTPRSMASVTTIPHASSHSDGANSALAPCSTGDTSGWGGTT